jgi:hypothetical protein
MEEFESLDREDPFFKELADLIRVKLPEPLTEETALGWLALLSGYSWYFHSWSLPEPRGSGGLTMRSASWVIADLWPDRSDPYRSHYVYWYRVMQDAGIEMTGGRCSAHVQALAETYRSLMLTHPDVISLEPDDWDPGQYRRQATHDPAH